jgi:uncharacterized coiled-coil DUF342 family protein
MTNHPAQILEFPRRHAANRTSAASATRADSAAPALQEPALTDRLRSVTNEWLDQVQSLDDEIEEARCEAAAFRERTQQLAVQLRVSRTLRDELHNQLAGALAENEGLRLTINEQAREIARLRVAQSR